MKKIFKYVAAAMVAASLSISAFAQDGRSLYSKYSDVEGVSAVCVSPALFRMIGRIPDVDLNGSNVNLAGIIKSMKGMYILNSEVKDVNNSIKRDAEKLVSKGGYELLVEAKENGDTVRMFTQGDDDTVNSLVMLTFDSRRCTFISFEGAMLRKDLEKVVAESTSKRER